MRPKRKKLWNPGRDAERTTNDYSVRSERSLLPEKKRLWIGVMKDSERSRGPPRYPLNEYATRSITTGAADGLAG